MTSHTCRQTQLTYRDAMAVYASDIPKHKVIMHKAVGILSVDGQQVKPERVTTRVTTKDFFAMFDVPFQYGGTWTDARGHRSRARHGHLAQDQREALRRREQRRQSASAGTTTSSASSACATTGCRCRRFYDVNNDVLEEPEDVYIPFGWNVALELDSAGNTNGWKPRTSRPTRTS